MSPLTVPMMTLPRRSRLFFFLALQVGFDHPGDPVQDLSRKNEVRDEVVTTGEFLAYDLEPIPCLCEDLQGIDPFVEFLPHQIESLFLFQTGYQLNDLSGHVSFPPMFVF